MQTTATEVNALAAATGAAAGSLAKHFVPFYLTEADENDRHAELLLGLHCKRKDGPTRDALWSGYWLTKKRAEQHIEALRERGGLLFAGQPGAITTARIFENERRSQERAEWAAKQQAGGAA